MDIFLFFSQQKKKHRNVVAVAGEDFAVIAADTRLSSGYSIHTRSQNKLFKLSESSVLGTSGCWPDSLAFTSLVNARIQSYKHIHNKSMSTTALAQMISIMMYQRRFFPYYVSNVLAGVDSDGKGCVYSYDPIGHCERALYRAGGSAGPLLQPILDNQIGYKNQQGVEKIPVTPEKAVALIKDVFISAAERDIFTGDSVIIQIITKEGIKEEVLPLRRD